MKNYIAMESSTGDLYQICAENDDKAYRYLGRDVLKMAGWNHEDFDTGNVDFDLYELSDIPNGHTKALVIFEEAEDARSKETSKGKEAGDQEGRKPSKKKTNAKKSKQ